MDVSGKVAVITGGGGGIGSALSEALALHGASVLLADLDERSAQQVAERLDAQYPGHAVGVGADVSASPDIQRVLALAERRFGPVDLYFAN
ncbi:MAG TPA: SDR family NAD(P)-dependent oxidoreductase, partial [Nevskiaceae bacterium]|nr:SDR family NAD(P)-dependent oxidoreductase [Nevskiaceae bacterium]